jgi:hypothetical protein
MKLALLLVLVPALAHADEHPTGLMLNTGVEIMGSGDRVTVVGRTHAAVTRRYGRIELGFGATIGAGEIMVDDRRALDNEVALPYVDYGPELHAGFAFGSGFVRNRVFASVSYLRVNVTEDIMIAPRTDLRGTTGMRATVGVNWARGWWRGLTSDSKRSSFDSDDDGGEEVIAKALLFVVPQQLEFGWEHSAGSDRVGVTFGWGL